MTNLITRAYVDGDAAPIADLMNLIEAADGADPFFAEADMRDSMTSWIKDTERDTRLVFAPDGSLVAVAMVAPPPPGGALADTSGGVRPDWRGQGIGRELFAWQLDRIAQMHAELAPGIEWRVDAATNVKDDSGIALFKRFGMTPERYFFDMRTPIVDPPTVATPAGLRIVAYTDDLLSAVYRTDMESFADHWGFEERDVDDWTGLTVGSETFRADLSRIAMEGDEVVAFLLGYDGVDNSLYIGQIGTRRPWRKRGVASALLAAALHAGAADRKEHAVLGVDADNPTGAVGVYERLGFTARARFVVYRRPLTI